MCLKKKELLVYSQEIIEETFNNIMPHMIIDHHSNHLETNIGVRIVSKILLKLFYECLIDHINIRFQNNDTILPKRMEQ